MRGDDRGQTEAMATLIIVGTTVLLSLFFGFVVFQAYTHPGDDVPTVAFDYDYDPGAERLTIRHAAGESFPAEEVVVVLRGPGGSTSHPWGEGGRVRAGDSTTLDGVTADSSVLVVWDRGPDERSYVLGEWER